MHVLVVNIGSTSFKFRLFDMDGERVLARGGVDGVGKPTSKVTLEVAGSDAQAVELAVPDQAAAIRICLERMTAAMAAPPQIDAVGFKAVHGGPIAEPTRVNDDVLAVMEDFRAVAPAHNPPYIAAMRAFAEQLPQTPLVAAFETGFHQTIPPARHTYAVPHAWQTQFGVRRYGFHGASHRFVAQRTAELLGRDDLRIISCHLGGSSSICAIQAGRSIANSFGMTPQAGLPQNNRVGDFDPYALLQLRERTGEDFDTLLARMSREGGLLGISGVSNDMREIIAAAESGNERAELALGVFVESLRDYLGAYVVALGGLDALVFTGGIGERSDVVRARACAGLEFLGIELDAERNAKGGDGVMVSSDASKVCVLTLETNEELIVARQTCDVVKAAG